MGVKPAIGPLRETVTIFTIRQKRLYIFAGCADYPKATSDPWTGGADKTYRSVEESGQVSLGKAIASGRQERKASPA